MASAANSLDKLKELELTRSEVERIGDALKQPEFRQLLTEYVEEIQNPENRKLYEEEITLLEKERGVQVTFINPQPGYVIKTSANGDKKCFINVCSNDNIAKPQAKSGRKDGTNGVNWSLPHTLTPPREDLDNKGVRCLVYDVVFNLEVLQRADGFKPFRDMVNATALEAVEKNFGITLDKKNAKFPKLKYKGLAHAAILKKPAVAPGLEREGFEKDIFDQIYAQADASSNKSTPPAQRSPKKSAEAKRTIYTTPKYVIKHRTHVDIQEFTESKDAKMHAATPKELVIEVNLPLIKCSSDITLDVNEKTLEIISEKPAKYKLNLTLPYRVNEDGGGAKFDKDAKKLIVTLPVKRSASSSLDFFDSGVDSDQGSPISTNEIFSDECNKRTTDENRSFLDAEVHYNVPEFTCHLFKKTLVMTLNVRNVVGDSLAKLVDGNKVHVKFSSVSSSFYPSHYAIYMQLPHQNLGDHSVSSEIWDNNVIIQINCDNTKIDSFMYGIDSKNLRKKIIDEPSILNDVLSTPIPEESELGERNEDKMTSNAISIFGTSYESSGDELSLSYSPSKSRGILKRLSSNRYFVGRSVSESSLDDYVSSSIELDNGGGNSNNARIIPEEDHESSSSLKKTVRFNDVIVRQLYRSNSSILGQKKKNQRKAKNKKRAQERRHSESEASEVEDKKEDDDDDDDDDEEEDNAQNHIHDIFHMDIN